MAPVRSWGPRGPVRPRNLPRKRFPVLPTEQLPVLPTERFRMLPRR